MIEAWVIDKEDDSASLPAWLAGAVKDRTEDGLFVLTSRAGIVEARSGDLILWDGERFNVYSGQRVAISAAVPMIAEAPRRRIEAAEIRKSSRAPAERRPGLPLVLALILFLGLLAVGYAWLMIKLIGHVQLHY